MNCAGQQLGLNGTFDDLWKQLILLLRQSFSSLSCSIAALASANSWVPASRSSEMSYCARTASYNKITHYKLSRLTEAL